MNDERYFEVAKDMLMTLRALHNVNNPFPAPTQAEFVKWAFEYADLFSAELLRRGIK